MKHNFPFILKNGDSIADELAEAIKVISKHYNIPEEKLKAKVELNYCDIDKEWFVISKVYYHDHKTK